MIVPFIFLPYLRFSISVNISERREVGIRTSNLHINRGLKPIPYLKTSFTNEENLIPINKNPKALCFLLSTQDL